MGRGAESQFTIKIHLCLNFYGILKRKPSNYGQEVFNTANTTQT